MAIPYKINYPPNIKKRFYYSDYYKFWSGNITEIIAVSKGLKPLSILRAKSIDEINHIRKICLDNNILLRVIKHSIAGDSEVVSELAFGRPRQPIHYLYLSKDINNLRWVERNVNKFNAVGKFNEELGLRLGYPKCCVTHYRLKPLTTYFKKIKINKIPFINNNIMIGSGSNTYLINHAPCSYNCPRTKTYALSLIQIIKRHEHYFYKFLMQSLREPLLVWQNFNRKANFLASLIAISFDGEIKENRVLYKNIFFSLPLGIERLKNLPLQEEMINLIKGNRILLEKGKALIYRDGKFLYGPIRHKFFIIKPI